MALIERAQKASFIELKKKPSEIVSVEVRNAGTNFFGKTYSYTLSDKTVYLKKIYEEIKVTYNTQVVSGYTPGIEQKFLNSQTGFFGDNIGIAALSSAGTTASTQRSSIEVSKNGSVLGLNVGGLVSLAENSQERVTTTDEPVVSILTDTVPGNSLSKTSTNKNDISTLTGTTVGDGFLAATITTGSPSGLNSALETEGIPVSKRKAALQAASTQPAVVEEVAVDTQPLTRISNSFSNQLIKTITRQSNFLGNPIGSFKLGGALGGFGFGSIGLPKTNLLGSLIGKLLGIPGANKVGDAVPGIPASVTLPTGTTPPPNIIDTTGSTNISQTVTTTTTIKPEIRNTTEPFNPKKTTAEFEGSTSSASDSNYVFEYVGGPEELKSELVNSSRVITTMVVHWTRTFSNLDWGSKEVGQLHTAWQTNKDNLPPGKTAVQRLLDLGVYSGLQFHYIIRKDGSIQRGRPLDIEGRVFTGFTKYAVHVAFVAGFTCPNGTPNKEKYLSSDSITPQQMNTFRDMVKIFDEAKNGSAEFVGFNQFTDLGMLGPGFDVPDFVANNFNKVSLYNNEDFKNGAEALSPTELLTRKPSISPVEPESVNNPPPTKPAPTPTPTPAGSTVDELGNIIPSQDKEDSENALWKQASADESRKKNDIDLVYDDYSNKLSDPSISETEKNKIETKYYNLYEDHRAAVLAKQRLKVRLIEEGYVYKESTGTWIHGSRYYG